MNLLDCSTPYFSTVPGILKLRPKALSTAIRIAQGQLESAPERMRHQLGDLTIKASATDAQAFMLPASLDYDGLSFAATKVLITCYAECKHSRTPFRITRTREQIAELARLSLPHARKAFKELEAKRLIEVKQLWRKGIQISLLDPEFNSGRRCTGLPCSTVTIWRRFRQDSGTESSCTMTAFRTRRAESGMRGKVISPWSPARSVALGKVSGSPSF
jgi:hypothetical protein